MFTNSSADRRLETRARRVARRVGFFVRKSHRRRTKAPNLDNFGQFMPIGGDHGCVVIGSRFDMSAEEVLEFCTRQEPSNKPVRT